MQFNAQLRQFSAESSKNQSIRQSKPSVESPLEINANSFSKNDLNSIKLNLSNFVVSEKTNSVIQNTNTNGLSTNNNTNNLSEQQPQEQTPSKISKGQIIFQAFVALLSVFFSGVVLLDAATPKRTAGADVDQERERQFAEQSNTTVKEMYRQIMKDETGLVNPKKQGEKAPIYRIVLTGGPCGGKSTYVHILFLICNNDLFLWFFFSKCFVNHFRTFECFGISCFHCSRSSNDRHHRRRNVERLRSFHWRPSIGIRRKFDENENRFGRCFLCVGRSFKRTSSHYL